MACAAWSDIHREWDTLSCALLCALWLSSMAALLHSRSATSRHATTSLPLHYHATTGPPDCRCEAGVRSASFMSAISCTGYCAQPPDNVEVIYYILCFCRRTLMFFYDRREFLWFPTKKTENRLSQVTFQRAYNDPSKPSCRYNCSKSLRFLAPGRSWQSRISVPRIQYIDKP